MMRSRATCFTEPILQRRQRTGPSGELDQRAPDDGGDVDPCHPGPAKDEPPTEDHENNEPEVEEHDEVSCKASEHRDTPRSRQ